MIKKLTAENAVIKTASVEVKTLTISGKQVTLAVFRQLKDEDVIDPITCQLLGMPWGTVNYHPDKCGDGAEHIHVIWQKGTELRRATIYKRHPEKQAARLDNHISTIRHDLNVLLAGWHIASFGETGQGVFTLTEPNGNTVSANSFKLEGGGWTGTFAAEKIRDLAEMRLTWNYLEYTWRLSRNHLPWNWTLKDADGVLMELEQGKGCSEDDFKALVTSRLREVAPEVLERDFLYETLSEYLPDSSGGGEYTARDFNAGADAALIKLKEAAKQKEEWLASYSALYQNLCELDHLFIAV